MSTLREFNSCGPCIPLGRIVKQTDKTVTYVDHRGNVQRRGGYAWVRGKGKGLLHTEPCPGCRDYPNGTYAYGWDG